MYTQFRFLLLTFNNSKSPKTLRYQAFKKFRSVHLHHPRENPPSRGFSFIFSHSCYFKGFGAFFKSYISFIFSYFLLLFVFYCILIAYFFLPNFSILFFPIYLLQQLHYTATILFFEVALLTS